MPERTFKEEVEQLRMGDGAQFHGEGILAVTKALLQSGVSYIGGYQGAPVSQLVDVLSDASDLLEELGVHLETSANEAGAAALLGASINYPIRGAVTFKSIVGTNVATDALSNLSSPGVTGGALIIVGEDYGEGSSIIQERSHAIAMKSQIWLLDPRPDLGRIVDLTEKAFELSEASQTPVMMELRIRVCHMTGSFVARDNRAPRHSTKGRDLRPSFDPDRISLPPATYVQETRKIEQRWPAAVEFIRAEGLNERFDGVHDDVGIVLQGGMYNTLLRTLQELGLADLFGDAKIPMLCLNVVHPLDPREIEGFCKGKKAVLVVEEGQPAFLEDAIKAILSDAEASTKVSGKDVLPRAGEYNCTAMLHGVVGFLRKHRPSGVALTPIVAVEDALVEGKAAALQTLGEAVPARPPGFCTGCPERPVFAALRLVEEQVGDLHVSADIGCHSFCTLPPFQLGNTILGYGLGLASSAGLSRMMPNPPVAIMGDGGFWHNGLLTGVANHVFNRDDGVLIILKNGYSSATGHQSIPSSGANSRDQASEMDLEAALRGVGVTWIEHEDTYRVGRMVRLIKRAVTERTNTVRVIVAEGECMLAKQRREKPVRRAALKAGARQLDERYGVDAATCTGDHSCIRLSGCPTLTLADNPDPLRTDPVAQVTDGCVACGNCGEVAHAAVLCPSFHKTAVVRNPSRLDRMLHRVRRSAAERLLTEAST